MVLQAQEYYPEEGPKLGQGWFHAALVFRIYEQALRLLGPRGYFSIYDMFLYYKQGTRLAVAPDLMCRRGLGWSPWKLWENGVPELVVEICSPKTGAKDVGFKWKLYERLEVPFYVIYDPLGCFQPEEMMAWEWVGGRYRPLPCVDGLIKIPAMELGFRVEDEALQMTDAQGVRVLTGAEEADLQRPLLAAMREQATRDQSRAEAEKERAEAEKERAEAALRDAVRLRNRLIALGADPDAP